MSTASDGLEEIAGAKAPLIDDIHETSEGDDDSDEEENENQEETVHSISKEKRESVQSTPSTKRRDSFLVNAWRMSATNRSSNGSKEANESGDSIINKIDHENSANKLAIDERKASGLRVVNDDIKGSSSISSLTDKIHKWGSIASYTGPDKHGHFDNEEEDEEEDDKASIFKRFLTQAGNKPSDFNPNKRMSISTVKSHRSFREAAKIKLFDVETKNETIRQSAAQITQRERESDARSPTNSTSIHTKSTVSIGMSKYPHAQEVSETFGTRLYAMKSIILAVLLNIALLLLGWRMTSELLLPIAPSIVLVTCGVIVEIIVLMTNELTIHTLDFGVAIFISMLMTNKSGYGMSACGFIQVSPIKRLKYAQSLSLNSPCRKTLERASYMWILLEATKILSPIAATGVVSSTVRSLAGTVSCIGFKSDPTFLSDRTYPTMESSAGVAEFLFGNALGCMRSERSDCDPRGSEFIFGPQLQGTVGSGDTIVGSGFHMLVATSCECTEMTSDSAVSRGMFTAADQALALGGNRVSSVPFLILSSTASVTSDNISFYSVLGNTPLCGGYTYTLMPVCLTTINEFHDAVVASSFETDGTTASIALTNSELLSKLPVTTMTSNVTFNALTTICPLGKPYFMGTNVPGLLNALTYWTSSDLKAVDPTLFDSGIETLYSILIRAGYQRTLDSKGTTCTRLVSRTDETNVAFNFQGMVAIYLIGWIQLILSVFSLILGSVWLFSPVPLGPAINIVTKPMYFISLLCESPFWVSLQGTANAQGHVVWQQLDHITRIGESLDTLGEPIGRIKIERPKMVKNLVNGRIYA
ncbi:hypothetical protein BCR33DRAFT_317577 [Rhizoclosmatium globosum]|uniref:Uncharacterized protein n=1 Tax=Rhizoclosmatium globosum TaxID=329046 RepID=A0A1Y2CZY1_9FUNG|nr:hypothetical protein BCR33DRAFT_317577 [Rhizoclosmatium globosum]|eukprot:ORY52424.1 hypothetical protein BCR33DRAFT_317577 [Rhizoclosmatium globosum]